jgi:hypothetical protein
MTHLTMNELVALRSPGREPGGSAAQAHLAACPACRAELDRLHQRVARLKALPSLHPSRDQWPAVRQRLVVERQRRRYRWLGAVGLGMAASVALLIVLRDLSHPPAAGASTEISEAMARSTELEQALDTYRPEARVTDGLTAGVAGELEDRIALIDRQLEMAQLVTAPQAEQQLLRLWRERVGLMNALVDVHVTRASNIGL